MSSGFPYRQPYAPVARWRSPPKSILMEEKFEVDEPPFDPFPTVTLIVKTAFCPLAMLHELFYGTQGPIADDEVETGKPYLYGVGKFYHRFASLVKIMVGEGKLPPRLDSILAEGKRRAIDEAFGKNALDSLEYYLRPWVQSRLSDGDLAASGSTYFEIQVANFTQFKDGRTSLVAPLVGRIDELDTERNRIIERTTREGEGLDSAPTGKDYQVWLLWKILSSIPKKNLPEPWRRDYSNTQLLVETPHHVYEVDKNNDAFEETTIRALSLIHDVCDIQARPKTIAWIYENAFTECRRDAKDRICGISICRAKRRTFPKCRKSIHSQFKWYYRAYFQETIWKRDKLMYQLLLLSRDDLRTLGIVYDCRILEQKQGKLKVWMNSQTFDSIKQLEPDERRCMILVGTPHFGIFTHALLQPCGRSECEISYEWVKMPSTHEVSILFPEASIFRPAPVFLNTVRQRRLYSLERWGKDRAVEAQKDPTIQLLEAAFGGLHLEMGGGFCVPEGKKQNGPPQ